MLTLHKAPKNLSILCVIPLENLEEAGSTIGLVICSMPTDLLVNSPVITMHGHRALNFNYMALYVVSI